MTEKDRLAIMVRRKQKVFCDSCGDLPYGVHVHRDQLLCHRCFQRIKRKAQQELPGQMSFADLAEGAGFTA